MAKKFTYIDTAGKEQTTMADSAEQAIAGAKNIASNSGVMAVDTMSSQPDPIVDSAVDTVNNYNKRGSSPTLTAETDKASSIAPIVKTKQDYRSEADRLAQDIAGSVTPSEANAKIREDKMLAEKEAVQRKDFDYLTKLKEDKRKRIEEIQTGAGLTKAQKDAAVAQESRVMDRRIADQSFTYSVSLGDYQGAEKIANEAIKDLQSDYERKTQTWSMLMKMTEMTDEEKMIANQAFEKNMLQERFEVDKKKALFDQTIRENDPLYKSNVVAQELKNKEAKAALDYAVSNPSAVSPALQKNIEGLSDGKRKDLVNAIDTTNQLNQLVEIIQSTDDISRTLNPFSEEGRKFRRIAEDVADKMARERTGAVVSSDEQKSFKKILGLSFGSQILANADELVTNLQPFINKHQQTISLIDPSGEIKGFINQTQPQSATTYVDQIEQEFADPVTNWVSNYWNK